MESSSTDFVIERFETDMLRLTLPGLAVVVTALSLNHHSVMSCRVLGALADIITPSMIDKHVDESIRKDSIRVLGYYNDDRHKPVVNPFKVKGDIVWGPVTPMELASVSFDAEQVIKRLPPDAGVVATVLNVWFRARARFTTPAEQIAAAMGDDMMVQ